METFTVLKPELLTLSAEQLAALAPYFWLFGGAVLAILLSVAKVFQPKWPVFLVAAAAGGFAACSSMGLLGRETVYLFNGMMVSDIFSNFFNIVFVICASFTVLASFRYLDKENLQHPEYYVLLLFSTLGMMLMASSLDLIVMFIALEIMSLMVYVMVGFRRADRRSNEASLKYFILGSAASALMLYGAALLYGATGTINLREIAQFVQSNPAGVSMLFTLGGWMLLLGFLFKVAAVPFHMWVPDVYEGAPTPVTGFMTTGIKLAAFATLIRVFVSLGYGRGLVDAVQTQIHDVIWACAALTMVIGNIVALTQVNLKRMLAYSSIAHTGYLLVGLLAGNTDQGYGPMVMYLVSYAIMNLGAFAVLTILAAREDHGLNLHDLSGLASRRPWLAFSMAVFLFSLAGIPPTAGFAAKYLLFYSAIQSGEIWLVIIGVLASAVSVYYYLRVLVFMYMRDPVGSEANSRVSVWAAAVVAIMVALTMHIGVLPGKVVATAKRVVSSL